MLRSCAAVALSVSNPLDIFLYNEKLERRPDCPEMLEQKQVLQVLAEPTLTTLSGIPAQFLSGGEFPFPVAQAASGSAPAITIQFRPYGVKMEFTPTVNPDGTIRIKLAPEVSTLDFSNAVTLSGFTDSCDFHAPRPDRGGDSGWAELCRLRSSRPPHHRVAE